MKTLPIGFILILVAFGCQNAAFDQTPMQKDPHSFSNPWHVRVSHLTWKATVDFNAKRISATAVWMLEMAGNSNEVIFDINDLEIQKVTLDGNETTTFETLRTDPILGQALSVKIKPDTKTVSITYTTSPNGEALQWLTPQQAGSQHPFLFTQSQAILARSWIPCQDSPSIRFTYDAEVTVPKELIALMSASNPTEKNATGVYSFKMQQPIPSYLLALTVGDIAFKAISHRSGVYAEPSVVDTAAREFADMEKMIAGAEELYGPYRWEQYDVIVLPPSFPFGGMENPRLTFATPTILSGDRSLTSLIAHELAHSWSGNLVTNATWNDFWLNEGFTVYFEHRIMEKLYSRDYSEMLAMLALQELRKTVQDLKEKKQEADTELKLDLIGRNPDEGVTDIAYNKGYFFLRSIEEKYGRDKFDVFVKDYFQENAFRAMDTESFIVYLKAYFKKNFDIELSDEFLNSWIYTAGLPADCPQPVSERFQRVDRVLSDWEKTGQLDGGLAKSWSTHEWMHFIRNLPDSLSATQMKALDAFGNFTRSGNAEILTAWLTQAIRHNYTAANSRLEDFLIHTGRRKFLNPLYNELVKTEKGKEFAKAIYKKARPNYHFVATNTFDKLLN